MIAKKCHTCGSNIKLTKFKEFFDGHRNGVHVGVYSEIIYYCPLHKPKK